MVKTNGALTADVATLDGHESDKDMDGAEDEFSGASDDVMISSIRFMKGRLARGVGLWQGWGVTLRGERATTRVAPAGDEDCIKGVRGEE